jgi:MFS family permease
MYFNNVQIFESWQKQFDSPDDHLLGLLGAFYQIGSVCSIPLVPIICDKWGRRPSIAIGFIIMAAGAAMQASAHNYGTFGGGRVVIGFGNSFAQIASPMLITEISHPQHRARFTTVYNCLWNGGAIIVNWFCFGLTFAPEGQWQWRLPAIFQGLPGLVQLVILWCMSSPTLGHDQDLELTLCRDPRISPIPDRSGPSR